ncbi:pseudouridine synthase [Dichotomopilus funicola]|uniref:Pseudouridine synthase n=1 Tax=Dichotomopilus funicola TaxID=1934379 RepID=A0AAN6V502_9PEZI|nr:pseudouridine synthase [Dichotomopilus funicola]
MSQRPSTHVPAVRVEAEKSLGITQRSAAINFAWTGDIRKRYTDFLVNEIQQDGTVLHLRDFEGGAIPPSASVLSDRTNNSSKKSEAKPDNKQNDTKPDEIKDETKQNETKQNETKQSDDKPEIHHIAEDERKFLFELLGESVALDLIELDESIQAKKPLSPEKRSVAFDAVTDRAKRGAIHQDIRRIFRSRFETSADGNGVITATAAQWVNNSRNNNRSNARSANWAARRDGNRDNARGNVRHRDQAREFASAGGDYLHFTLYKENKDTMDAMNTMARLLKIKASNFGFAGTKDRRAATVQRISVYRQKSSGVVWLNSRIPNLKIGDFQYHKNPLQLGHHGGNEFVITLKNCQPLSGDNCSLVQRMNMIQQAVECGLAYLKHNGYINYYGLQRFGTYTIGTHLLGMKILQGEYESFIDDILHVDDELLNDVLTSRSSPPSYANGNVGREAQNNRDDHDRARAITLWNTTKKADKALEFLPKRFSTELSIIRHLGKNQKDFTGALLSITRGMRMMYIHAYQSYVWNFVATRRWSKYGAKVIEGDLVLVPGTRPRDLIVEDEVSSYDDNEGVNTYDQAYALTEEDVASGKYTIFDVVLPTPGYDVVYPINDIGEYYVEFMAKPENGGLDPFDMRRRQREFSLSGNYRPLIGRLIGSPQYAVRAYRDDTEQMYPTDYDYALQKKEDEKAAKAKAQSRAEGKLTPNADPVVNSWAHFSQNPDAYDNAIDTTRRRKADEETPLEKGFITNETWVQTTVDGSAKRVKVARHKQQIDPVITNEPASVQPAAATPSLNVDGANEEENDGGFPVGRGASLLAASPARQDTPTAIDVADQKDVEMNEATPTTASSETPEVKQSTSDSMGWYGGQIPKIPTVATEPIAQANAQVVHGVPVPELRTVSDNPLLSPGVAIDEAAIDPEATKISVILKFQLKASNYATIVLRELMGTTVEELTQ